MPEQEMERPGIWQHQWIQINMEKDDKTVIDPELGLTVESSVQIKWAETESRPDYPTRSEPPGSDCMVKGYVPKVRPSEANGSAVSTRSKRLKSVSCGGIGSFDKVGGNFGICSKGDESVVSNGEVEGYRGDTVYPGGSEGNLGDSGYIDGEMVEVEVREEPMVVAAAVARSNGTIRFTRSVIKSKDDKLGISGGLQDAFTLEVERLESGESNGMASPNARQMEISNKITLKARPTTVKELFETGLLEGYPVFYNGGNRGFPLRGIIKDTGILCSCSSCEGVRVVAPCRFEIHACKSHRRASQYISLANGKSLLDVVKECQKSSVKTLEETIHEFVGPMPVKESVICMNCQVPFLATASKVEPVCDSCMIIENSGVDAECIKSGHLELASNTKSPQRSSLQISTRKDRQKITKNRQQPIPKFSRSALASHSKSSSDLRANGSYSSQRSMRNNNTRKILKKFSSTSLSKPLKSGSAHISMKSKSSSKIIKQDQKMHRMVFEDGGLADGTEVAYYSNGKKLRDGYKMGSGIICRCCSTLVSPSQFEAHAGRASRRKPYMYIYTSNGVSLHEFAVSLLKEGKFSAKKERKLSTKKERKLSAKDHDDMCIICADGGKLVLRDGCPRAFHKECVRSLLLNIERAEQISVRSS